MSGVYISPNGGDSKQKSVLKQKAIHLGERIRTGFINKRETWLALTHMALKAITKNNSSVVDDATRPGRICKCGCNDDMNGHSLKYSCVDE